MKKIDANKHWPKFMEVDRVSNMIENIRTEKYKIAVRSYLPDGRIHTVVGIDTYSIGDATSNIANCKFWDHKLADIGLADYWLIPAS